MKFMKWKILVVSIMLCILMTSCENPFSSTCFSEQFDFEYVLSVVFENKSDENIFIARLNAIGCDVSSTQEKDGQIEYILKAKDFIKYDEFDFLCKNYALEVYDNNGNELLNRENVVSATGLILMYAKTSTETLQKIKNENITEMIFKLDGTEYAVDVKPVEEILWISQHPNKANDILLKAIVYFSSDDIIGNIHIENIKRTK